MPVVAAGSKRHRTLIWDFWVGLIRDIFPPASVMGWHHVVMNLLKEYEGAAEMKGNQQGKVQLLGTGKGEGADSLKVRLLTESLIWLRPK